MSIDTWLKIAGMAGSALVVGIPIAFVFYYKVRRNLDCVAEINKDLYHEENGLAKIAETVRRDRERLVTVEKIIFVEGEGLKVMTISHCERCRDDCRKHSVSETDSKIKLVAERIEGWSKSINALAEAMDKRFQVQEKRWKVVVKHIIRTTALTEMLSERETGLKLKGLESLIISDEDLGLEA